MRILENNMFLTMARTAWRHAGDKRPLMVLFYALFIIANLVVAMQPVVLAHIINAAAEGGENALHDALLWSAAYGGLTLFFWTLHGPARVIERRTGFTAYRGFVASLYRKVTEMPLRWHQDHHSGNTINRINKAGKALYTFAQGQFVIIQSAVRFCASFIVLALYSWWVAAAALVVSGLIVTVIRRFDKKLIPMVRGTNEREHHLNAALYDYIGNIVTVLTLRLQGNTAAEINQRFGAMQRSFWPETTLNEYKWGVTNLLLTAVQAGIVGAYVGVHLWRQEPLVIGSVVAIFQYLLMIMQLFFQGMLSYEQLTYQHTDVHGVDGLLEDHARLVVAAPPAVVPAWREIRIEGLRFTHREGEDELHHLRDISLAIGAGRKIALVGSSGAGKTTLLTLMRGLYEPQRVRLTIDGDEFATLMPLSGFTTLVPQDSEIFENTIQYNLTLGTAVSDEVVMQALEITTFDEVALRLPQGVRTDIRERGVNLSGGQKQRLALTRGLIAARGSSLLLLDEPTSSVDLPTESVIFDRLFEAFADKAIVASIHRLHLLPRFDHICLMQDGAITAQGSFAGLLAQRGDFHQLWQRHLAQGTAGEEEGTPI